MNMGVFDLILKHFADVKYSTGKKTNNCKTYQACDVFDCMDD